MLSCLRLRSEDAGQNMLEYALLAGFIAMAIIGGIRMMSSAATRATVAAAQATSGSTVFGVSADGHPSHEDHDRTVEGR
jgi:Flp pilus assembly pilin Flp